MRRTGRGAVRKQPPPRIPHEEQLLHEVPSRQTQILICFASLFVICYYCVLFVVVSLVCVNPPAARHNN